MCLMDETTRDAIRALADLIVDKLEQGADAQYIAEHVLGELDTLAGDVPRAARVFD